MPAYEENLKCVSVLAGSDLSASQFRFVKVAADGEVDRVGDGLAVDGILQDKPDAQGRAGTMAISGISKCLAGGTVTAGDDIASDANGAGVLATTGDVVAGRAMTGASSGQIFSILLNPQAEPLS